jgi:hypothetical protein
MANLNRRSFIEKAAIGGATVGALVTLHGYVAPRDTAEASTSATKHVAQSGPVLAHVRNAATGEIAVLFGTREVVIHDAGIADRIMRAIS